MAKAKKRATKSRSKPKRRPSSPASAPTGSSAATTSPGASKRREALAAWLCGERVTTHGVRLVLDYYRPLMKRVPQALVIDLLGTSKQALAKWTAEGAPRNDDGAYDLGAILPWLYKRWVKAGRRGVGVPDADGQLPLELDYDRRIKLAKAISLERGNREADGRLVDRDLVGRLFVELAGVLKLALKRLPELAGLGAKPVTRDLLVAYRDQVVADLSRMAVECAQGLGDEKAEAKRGSA